MSTKNSNETIDKLIEIVSNITKINKCDIDINENLIEMGLDSIVFTRINSSIISNFEVEIPFSKVYEELPDINKIAEYLELHSKYKSYLNDATHRPLSGEIGKVYSETAASIAIDDKSIDQTISNKLENINKLINKVKNETEDINFISEIGGNHTYEFHLTKEQESILVQSEMSGTAFNESLALRVLGTLDLSALQRSIDKVVERHESLRTIIDKENKKQRVLANLPSPITIIEKDKRDTNLLIESFVTKSFSYTENLFRTMVIKENEEQSILVLVVHHIIADGWSVGVLLNEITELYNSDLSQKTAEIENPLQFREYIEVRNELICVNDDKGSEFRNKNYSKTDNYLDLSIGDFSVNKGFTGARFESTEEKEMLKQLRKVSAMNNTSFFNTMLSVFIAFLNKVSQSNHITVGVPFAGQNIINIDPLVGNCVEMIGVHIDVEESDNLNSLSDKVSQFFKGLDETSYLHKMNAENSYNVVFNMIKNVNISFLNTKCEYIPVNITESKYDLFLSIIEFNNQVIFRFDYNKEVISGETLNRWSEYYKEILRSKLDKVPKPLSELTLISGEEEENILNHFSTFKFDYIERALREDLSQYGLLEEEEVRAFILDKNMQLSPKGMTGEIYIGPNRIEIYNTNKLGRILDDGELIVLGEEEKQLVIKGRRVSLYTIEGHLSNNPTIIKALCEWDEKNEELIAYIVAKDHIQITSEFLIELKKNLPGFIIPDIFIQVSSLENRTDKVILEHKEQMTATESKILNIWKEVLDVKNISLEDNFFHHGGNSLKAMKVIAKVQKEFNKSVQIKALFEEPTIKNLSLIIDDATIQLREENVIPITKHSEFYQLSSVQRRMYALHKLDPNSLNYNVSSALRITGHLDPNKLEDSINTIIKRHETLRTYFEEMDESVVQRVVEHFHVNVQYTEKNDSLDEKRFIESEIKAFLKSFDLNKLPLIRVKLVRIKENDHLMLLDIHHIVFDGSSSVIFLEELLAEYNGLELPELQIQYKDYTDWKNRLNAKEMKEEAYWKKVLTDDIPVLSIQTDFPRPTNQTFNGNYISLEFDEKVSGEIEGFCKNNQVTPYMFFLAGLNILLSKYSGQEDIVIGTAIEGRNHLQINNLIGMFVNTIPLRNQPSSNQTFIEFLHHVKESTLNAFEHSDYPFEDIVNLLNIERDKSRNPLFDVLYTFQNNLVKEFTHEDMEICSYEIKKEGSKVDLFFEINQDVQYQLNIEYNTDIFNKETIERIGLHFETLIVNTLNRANENISEIQIINDDECSVLLHQFNDTCATYPKDKTIHQLFEEQVLRTPNHPAVVFGEEELSYQELNERSNQLAWGLRKKGVKPDTTVGIMVERSLEMMIGIFAILKAGGAYLPIDPAHPKERISYILENSGTNVLLTKKNLQSEDGLFSGETIYFEEEVLLDSNSRNLPAINTPGDLAYVIYTSGTTGKPKGVMIEHRSLVNRLNWMQKNYPLGERDVILQKTPYTFDVSVWELLWWSIVGSTVVLLAPKQEKEPVKILEAIYHYDVTTMHFVPSMLHVFLDYLKVTGNMTKASSLKQVFTSGEALKTTHANIFHEVVEKVNLINLYGPTEATIDVTYYNCPSEKQTSIPIGRPIDNTKMYIVDENLKLVPLGVVGELCISGDGVARGYLNNEQLTSEKFVYNPYEPGKKLYKTGDLAKWLPDGNIEYLGRTDNQIKIRGFRIELGEVEKSLLTLEGIQDVVVIVKEKEDDKELAAYYLGEYFYTADEVRKKLKAILPEYMIPTYFTKLDSMPTSPNGKVDRKALPEPDINSLIQKKYESPQNELQTTLAGIWGEVLKRESIGIHDNFFEIGGHSLKATGVTNKVYQRLQVEVSLKEFFENPTIKELSDHIEGKAKNQYEMITPCAEQDYYEASSAQKRMYMIQQLENGTVYNMPMVFEVEDKSEPKRMQEAFQKLVTRHESLRTYFDDRQGELVQKIQPDLSFSLGKRDGNGWTLEALTREFVQPFELNKAPLIRAELAESDEVTYLMIDMHHIISDGMSIQLLLSEFMELYNGHDLEPLRIQYKDFAAWQNKFLASVEIKKQEEYWIQQFKDDIPVLNLPYDYKRPLIQSFEGNQSSFYVNEEQAEALRKVANETGSTMHMVLLSAFYILLSKYSGQEDLVIGTPVAGRPHADLQNIIGMFVNTLALRNNATGEKSYTEFLQEVKNNSLLAYDNQSYQFEQLIDRVGVDRDTGRHPLFDVMFNMNHAESDFKRDYNGTWLKPILQKSRHSKFDLTLHVTEQDSRIKVSFEYGTRLFKEETIDRMGQHFNEILSSISRNKEAKLSEITMMKEAEIQHILTTFKNTDTNYPREKTIQELFEEQVEKTPYHIAVKFEDKTLTYKELNEKSNQLARVLRLKGIKEESIVGLMVDRSLEMIVGILGILKAGGAYLPIDPKFPRDRKEYMIKDSGISLLVITSNFENFGIDSLKVDFTDKSIFNKPSSNLPLINKSNDLAYIIYTSGTTGNPKGVMVEHKNVVRLMINDQMQFEFTDKDIWTMFHSHSFDFSVWEMYGALLYGGKLIIVPDLVAQETAKYLTLLKDEKVTVLNQTPTAFYNLMKHELESKNKDLCLRYIIFGGESLKPIMLHEWIKKYNATKMINMYGITETTVHVTYKEIGVKEIRNGISIIGKPIPTLTTFIVDENLNIQPIGVPGELCIGGDGVTRGYLNKDQLTREKFIQSPYNKNEKVYRSGDLVRLLSSGEIEYLGRIDHQVKIRGFRIELGEIENRLASHNLIKEAVVSVKEDEQNQNYLCAYVVCHEPLDKSDIKMYLKEHLPDYMIPSFFMELEAIPLTSNGKVNRNALPEPDASGLISSEYEAPQTEIQEKLVTIWKDVLGVETIGIHDNFFDLGGHSLKATVVMSELHKVLQVEVPLKELFTNPTIIELSSHIETSAVNPFETIEPCERKEFYETSSAQKRMYTLQQLEEGSTAYNMSGVLELEGEMDLDRIETAFKQLVQRHEALRTYYETVDGDIVQRIHPDETFTLTFSQTDETDISNIAKNFIRPFKLDKAPLFRAELVESHGTRYLLIDMHHIISDGVSMSILIREITKLYNGESLEPLRIQYKDFAQWQNEFFQSGDLKKQDAYWKNQFREDVPVLHLPYDYERPTIQSFEGDSVKFILDEEMTEGLRKMVREEEATLHMVLLAAFNVLLSKYSGQEDIVVGVPIAGRPHADLQNIMGMFVNTLAMRNQPGKEKTFKEFLAEVKGNSLQAYDNQSYQLEELIGSVQVKRERGRNPLFDVMFDLNNIDINADIEFNGLTLRPRMFEDKIAKFDLTLVASETSKNIEMSLEYSSMLFKKETMDRAIRDFKLIISSITTNDDITLNQISIRTEAETELLLQEEKSLDEIKNQEFSFTF
ncbi:amino acid adenylation domain-containing protein [Peribacillus simplex]|uniref:non-ribosomal peptide synthetase n=1 Tax=Peribacillus simplex TaxID=1478 RepID=UPI00298D859F|nr:non-ribosomal peptide synthetase [Peribacillus simplex]MDW7617333.1 amino acid adenylation domain-containing protein [Peribacillus simplex]